MTDAEVERMLDGLRARRDRLDAAIVALEALKGEEGPAPEPRADRTIADTPRPPVARVGKRRAVPAARSRGNGSAGDGETIEQRMLAVMANGEEWTAPQVAGVLDCKVQSAAAQLAKSTEAGSCLRVGHGRYRRTDCATATRAARTDTVPTQQVGPHQLELRGKLWTCVECWEQRETPGGFIPLAECAA